MDRGKDTLLQLFVVFAILVVTGVLLFLGFGWLETRMGSGVAFGLGIAIFIVLSLFIQQYISGWQNKATMQNLVSFNADNAKIEQYRQQTTLEGMKTTRAVLQNEAFTTKQLEQRAAALATVMSKAEVERIRGEMLGLSGPTVDGESGGFTLE